MLLRRDDTSAWGAYRAYLSHGQPPASGKEIERVAYPRRDSHHRIASSQCTLLQQRKARLRIPEVRRSTLWTMLRRDDAPMLRCSDAPKQIHSYMPTCPPCSAPETMDVLLFIKPSGSEAALVLFPRQDLCRRQPATVTRFPLSYPIT